MVFSVSMVSWRASFLRALDQRLRVDAAEESHLVAEIALQPVQLHARAVRLHRLDAVEPDGDHVGDEVADRSVAVQHHELPELVSQVHEPLQVRQDEAAELARAEHRAVLRAQVVADEEDVDRVARLPRRCAG